MNRYSKYIAAVILALLSMACIRQKEEDCPPEGSEATIAIRAEKFLARTPYDRNELEENFNARIHGLSYFLYRDGELLRMENLDNEAAATSQEAFMLRLNELPYGEYLLAFAANTPDHMRTGSAESPDKLFVLYQSDGNSDDSFILTLPFNVRKGEPNTFDTVLHRVHGVTLFRFENIPDEVTAMEVTLTNVAGRSSLSGRCELPLEVTRRIDPSDFPSRKKAAFAIGTFATVPGETTSWRLKIYSGSDTPSYEGIAAEGLTIESNQLTELKTRFPQSGTGDLEFTVNLNTEWNGSTEGGGTVIVN